MDFRHISTVNAAYIEALTNLHFYKDRNNSYAYAYVAGPPIVFLGGV